MFKRILPLILLMFSVSCLHAQTRAYVVLFNFGPSITVGVIDTSTNTVIASIPLTDAFGITVSPDGSRAYVNGSNTFSVIDTASNTVIASIPIQGGGNGLGFPAVSPDGSKVYLPDARGTVYVISAATNTIVTTISINDEPSSLAITPDGSRAYVLGVFGTVSIVDTASNTVVQTIPVNSFEGTGVFPGIAITPDGRSVYVLGLAVPNASVIDTATNTVTTIPLLDNFCSFCTNAVAITPDGSRVYVADNSNQVEVIDTATNTVEPTPIAMASTPLGVAVTPDGASVYNINFDGTVSVISTATNTVATTIQSGSPFGFPGIAIANLSPRNPGNASSIAASFNGTAVPSADSLWFSSVASVSGLGSSPVTVSVRKAAITYTVNSTQVTVAVPDADLTFDPSATTATTTFDTSTNRWNTVVPSHGLAGNVFLDGAEEALPNGLLGGVKNVTWTANFSSNTPGLTVNWKWAAAAYSSLCGPDLNCLGVKPVDDNHASQFQNSDHAGTPETQKSNLIPGARGGGGSNYTGGYSGTTAVTPTAPR